MALTPLLDAVGEIIDELQTIQGIRRVPDEPPINNEQFPFVVAIPDSGTYELEMTHFLKGLHDIRIELHVALKDLPRDYYKVMELIDVIPYEIAKKLKDAKFTKLATYSSMTYVFDYLKYGDVNTLGVIYTMTNVKIETTVS